MYDIVIVGAGTAGLSAAIYGVRAGKKVLVLEGQNFGGQIINSPEIENYPGIAKTSGFEFASGLYEQASNLGALSLWCKAIPGGARSYMSRAGQGSTTQVSWRVESQVDRYPKCGWPGVWVSIPCELTHPGT